MRMLFKNSLIAVGMVMLISGEAFSHDRDRHDSDNKGLGNFVPCPYDVESVPCIHSCDFESRTCKVQVISDCSQKEACCKDIKISKYHQGKTPACRTR